MFYICNMSETKKQKMNVTSIPEDKVVELKIGGLFYQRLNKLLINFGDSLGKDKLLLAMAKIQRDKAHTDDFAYNLETLMVLIRDVEAAFKEAGATVENEVEIEVPTDLELPDLPGEAKVD